jgi:hypothetical protein
MSKNTTPVKIASAYNIYFRHKIYKVIRIYFAIFVNLFSDLNVNWEISLTKINWIRESDSWEDNFSDSEIIVERERVKISSAVAQVFLRSIITRKK